jgi:LysM repeat protein
MKTAFSQIGNPYRYGGNSPETGFDCSGFVSWVYKQYGVTLPRSSRDMLAVGVPIEKEDLRPGDLVFFNYGYSHVGIYTGNDKYIHSPRTGKSIQESDINGRGRKDRFVGARRVIDNQGINSISDRLKTEWISQSRHLATLDLNEKTAIRHTGSVSRPKNTVQTAKGSSIKIKVVSGDNLVGLAKKYGVSTNDLVAANNLKNKHQLKLGQVLVVPQKGKAAKTTQVASNQKTQATKAGSHVTAKAQTTKKTAKASVSSKSQNKKSKSLHKKASAKSKTKAKTTAKKSSQSSGKSKTVSKSSAKSASTSAKVKSPGSTIKR